MLAFFRRAIKSYRNSCCRAHNHFWKDDPVLNVNGEPTRIVVRCCRNCSAKYTWWKGDGVCNTKKLGA